MEQTEVTTQAISPHIEISPEEIIIYFQRLKHKYESFGISHFLPPVSTKEMVYALFKDNSVGSHAKRNAIIPYLYALLEISASKNAFKCHDECFHIDWLEFYRCPQTTINECILIIQEAQLIARKYRRSIEDMNAMLAEAEKLKVSQFDARNAAQIVHSSIPCTHKNTSFGSIVDETGAKKEFCDDCGIEITYEEPQRDIQSEEPISHYIEDGTIPTSENEPNEPIEYQGADKETPAPSIPMPSVPVRKFFKREQPSS